MAGRHLHRTGDAGPSNTIMLGAFTKATGWVDKDELEKVIGRFFGAKNVETFRRGYGEVKLHYFD